MGEDIVSFVATCFIIYLIISIQDIKEELGEIKRSLEIKR